jgi:F0F1-type ATP synthase delta subunit|tara:strand:- start:169163 stop:169531 length:369 start_codon:yes stop_codon:yes gene_type:complete
MEKEYAQAIAHLSHTKGQDETVLVEGLMKHLRATGRTKLLPGITRELRALEERKRKLSPVLEVASLKEEAGARKVLEREGIVVESVVVNPSLIRGWRARSKGLLWDHSAKRALTDIYKQITN